MSVVSEAVNGSVDQRLAFVEFALDTGVLQFGDFTLKSGRSSPYFFNAGLFRTGQALATLGRYYAAAVVAAGPPFDVLMGPAYKGIPIASSTAVALADQHQVDVPWCFNRKESKDHGEGGMIVGAPLSGGVLIVDDVITAGTAIGEAHQLIAAADAKLAGIVVALDRQERGAGELSAVAEVERAYNTRVVAISTLDDIVAYLEQSGTHREHLDSMRTYREAYAVR